MAFAQLLMHLADRNAEKFGDPRQVIGWFVGVQDVVAGRNTAHRASVEPGKLAGVRVAATLRPAIRGAT